VDSRSEDLTRIGKLLPRATLAMDIAAGIVRDHLPAVIRAKGDRDMVSDIDIQIERAVRGFLQDQTPDIGFMGRRKAARAGPSCSGSLIRSTEQRTSLRESRCTPSRWR
jgi:hypothetical protein